MYTKLWRRYMKVSMVNNFIKEKVSLKDKNSLRIESIARFYAEPRDVDELMEAIYFADKRGIKVLFLGGGSNILFPDSNLDALVVSFSQFRNFMLTYDGVITDAGVKLPFLLKKLSDKGFGGLEFTVGIPATIGGAVRMNLGSMGKEIFDFVQEIFVIEEGIFKRIKKEDIKYGYRKGYTKGIIISVYLKLERMDKIEIKRRIKKVLYKKRKVQPLNMPSAGCVFKNPKIGVSAGRLLDEAGLKGYTVGGAMFSTLHANFIVNKGNATSRDIKELINIGIERVYKKFRVILERELLYAEEILK